MRAPLVLPVIASLTFGAGLAACNAGSDTSSDDGDYTPSIPETPPEVVENPDGTPRFSFFVTSLEAMRELSGSTNGFGGDLRFGEATGLEGADKICRTIAEKSLAGAGQKTWRAFLSASTGPDGVAVNAIERIGEGPWYDRTGRLLAENKAGLLAGYRPLAEATIKNDLPNEWGVPNHQGVDNHDTLTGSTAQGRFSGSKANTCNDWTSAVGSTGKPMCGHAWPRGASTGNGAHWIADHTVPGCAPGVTLTNSGGGGGSGSTVGGAGGYGAIYCFALTP